MLLAATGHVIKRCGIADFCGGIRQDLAEGQGDSGVSWRGIEGTAGLTERDPPGDPTATVVAIFFSGTGVGIGAYQHRIDRHIRIVAAP